MLTRFSTKITFWSSVVLVQVCGVVLFSLPPAAWSSDLSFMGIIVLMPGSLVFGVAMWFLPEILQTRTPAALLIVASNLILAAVAIFIARAVRALLRRSAPPASPERQ